MSPTYDVYTMQRCDVGARYSVEASSKREAARLVRTNAPESHLIEQFETWGIGRIRVQSVEVPEEEAWVAEEREAQLASSRVVAS